MVVTSETMAAVQSEFGVCDGQQCCAGALGCPLKRIIESAGQITIKVFEEA